MNTILYIGLGLMLVGFVGFLISASMENYYNKKLKDLNKKYNFEYIKIKISKASTMQIQTFALELGIIAKQWLRKVGVKIEVMK